MVSGLWQKSLIHQDAGRLVFQEQADFCGADPRVRDGRPRPSPVGSTTPAQADEGVGRRPGVRPTKPSDIARFGLRFRNAAEYFIQSRPIAK